MRLAIIGGGVSGLFAARKLHQNHDITVFESGSYAGGHTNTVDVETTIVRKLGWAEIDGRQVRVLYIDHESSSRPNASTVVLSTGITAFWERDGVAMRLVGSTLDNQ